MPREPGAELNFADDYRYEYLTRPPFYSIAPVPWEYQENKALGDNFAPLVQY